MMLNDFLTIDMLRVFLVAVSVTVILTEFFKEAVDWVFAKIKINIPTKYVTLFFALLIVFLPIIIDGLITVEIIATGILNAILLSLTAMKSYETILEKAISKIEKKQDSSDSVTGK